MGQEGGFDFIYFKFSHVPNSLMFTGFTGGALDLQGIQLYHWGRR